MRLHIREHISAVAAQVGRAAVHRVIATSATAGAIVCAVHNVKRSQRDQADRLGASAQQIGDLLGTLVGRNLEGRAGVVGVGRRRAEIIVAGVAVMDGIMCGLRLPRLQYSTAGVREGIIAELAQRGGAMEDDPASWLNAATN